MRLPDHRNVRETRFGAIKQEPGRGWRLTVTEQDNDTTRTVPTELLASPGYVGLDHRVRIGGPEYQGCPFCFYTVREDLVAKVQAFIADERRLCPDQVADLRRGFSTEGTMPTQRTADGVAFEDRGGRGFSVGPRVDCLSLIHAQIADGHSRASDDLSAGPGTLAAEGARQSSVSMQCR
jgi:hypothetical protein